MNCWLALIYRYMILWLFVFHLIVAFWILSIIYYFNFSSFICFLWPSLFPFILSFPCLFSSLFSTSSLKLLSPTPLNPFIIPPKLQCMSSSKSWIFSRLFPVDFWLLSPASSYSFFRYLSPVRTTSISSVYLPDFANHLHKDSHLSREMSGNQCICMLYFMKQTGISASWNLEKMNKFLHFFIFAWLLYILKENFKLKLTEKKNLLY